MKFNVRSWTAVATLIVFGFLTFGLWTTPITREFTEFGHLAVQAAFIALAAFVSGMALFMSDDW